MSSSFPDHRIVNLTVEGRAPLATLFDLAEDDHFNGIALVAVTATSFLPEGEKGQQGYVDYFHAAPLDVCLNATIESKLQSVAVSLGPQLSWQRVVGYVIKGKWPPKYYVQTYRNRSRAADYSMIDVGEKRRSRVETVERHYQSRRPLGQREWLAQVSMVASATKSIRKRGGEVVLIRFPTTGRHYELDEFYYPKERYWDQIESAASTPTIHFTDLPGVSNIDCPDTSHIDKRDSPVFTETLCEALTPYIAPMSN